MKSVFDIDNESGLTAALVAYCDKHELPQICANELLMACHGHVVWLAAFCDQWEKVQGANDRLVQTMLEQGFEREQGGGGCCVLSLDMESGAFVWVTCLDGGGLPETDNWHVCAYGDDIGDIICELRSDQNDSDLSISQAVAIAIDVANDFEPTPCTNWHRHRDSGRGVCIDCGEFI
jgi:hypothetical protein